jgi:Flp pilus assembly protein TadB
VLGLDLDFDQAKNVALVAAVACGIGAVAAIWILKSIVQKVVVALLLLLLGYAAWSQREALQDCASKVQASIEIVTGQVNGGTTVPTDATAPVPTTVPTEVPTELPAEVQAEVAGLDTSCTFFGVDVPIP